MVKLPGETIVITSLLKVCGFLFELVGIFAIQFGFFFFLHYFTLNAAIELICFSQIG